MNRSLLLSVAVLVAVLAPGAIPSARADRLGGNYRGPDDLPVVREDPPPPPPPAGKSGGDGAAKEGGSASGDEGTPDGGGGEDGDASPPPPPGNPDGGYRGPAGGSSGDSRQPEDPPPEEEGGGTPDAGGTPGPQEPDAGPGAGTVGGTAGADPPAPDGGASGGLGKGSRTGSHDDKDRTWTFYFESSKEEYLATVLARRPEPRLAPAGTCTFALSLQPEPRRAVRPILETDRLRARDLAVERLRDPDSHVRDAAVIALGKSGYEEAVPLLRRAAARDPDAAVREDALLALGLTGRLTALRTLIRALEAPAGDRRDRRAAFAALGLGLLGEREWASEPLRAFYAAAAPRPDRVDDAVCAATALGMLGDAGALPLFEKTIASGDVPEAVKCYTLHAAGKFGSHAEASVRRAAFGILSAALADRKDLKQSALLALGDFTDVDTVALLAKEGLLDPDAYCRSFAAHSIGRIAGRAGPGSREHALAARELARVAEGERRDRWLFQAGNLALSSMAFPGHEKPLLDLAGNPGLDLHSASSVALSLGLLGSGSEAVTGRLREDFEARSAGADVRGYAGLALAMTGADGTAASLVKTLREEQPAPAVARSAALALGLVGGAKEVELLLEVLAGGSANPDAEGARYYVLGASVQGIGLIGDGDTVAKLLPLLASDRWRQRAFATAALGYVLEPDPAGRIAPRISGIFRHHNYRVPVPVVRAVQSTL